MTWAAIMPLNTMAIAMVLPPDIAAGDGWDLSGPRWVTESAKSF
jgi:hypothetical protein